VPVADALVVGAGCNGLACAVLLAGAGWRVTVLERADEPGGAVRTAEVTLPGFRHDLYATNLNLFAGSPLLAELRDELVAEGLELCVAPRPFGSVFPHGRFVGVSTDADETAASVAAVSERDADAWRRLAARFADVAPHVFPLLGASMPSLAAARLVWRGRRALGREWPFDLARLVAQSSRAFAEEHFESRELRALVAAWGMHLDFPPDVPGGALFSFLETFASAANGMALGKGGARTMIDALVGMLRRRGGELRCGAEVERILVEGGRAVGVELAVGEPLRARRAVIANLTPTVLARLLADPPDVSGYRYGPGTLMVHLALDDVAPWASADARRSAYVHVAPYLEDMALAYQRATAGLLPERPTLVVAQPTVVDPSRAPDRKHVLWVQARVVPASIAGDAAGEIEARSWDEATEPFADRVLDLLEAYAPGLRRLVLGRHVLSPLDLERANPNLVGGDQLSGSHHAFQHFFLRPLPGWSRYRTPVERLYLCGAATWPGAGVGAGSGYLLAKALIRRLARRALRPPNRRR
jgi:phytoene dehydrogenase-like protein